MVFSFESRVDDVPRPWLEQVAAALGTVGRDDRTVPLTVWHDWHAGTAGPIFAAAARRHGRDAGLQETVVELHERALTEDVSEHEWAGVLEPALREIYQHAYAFEDAYAVAHASAQAYASANNFDAEAGAKFAHDYATTSTTANAKAFADANASANANAMAAAYAAADPQAFAETYPYAYIQACLRFCGDARERLAAGLLDSLARHGF